MSDALYRAVLGLGEVALRGLDLQVRADGLEHLPSEGPVLLAANHVSFPDFVYVGKAVRPAGRLVRFLCRADMWDTPLGPALTAMGHVPVDREAPAAAYLTARRLLRAGEVVCAFPEAGISSAYVVRALMPGAAALAQETGAPLLPVTLCGGQRWWAQKRSSEEPLPRPVPRRGLTVDVRLGAPIRVGAADDVTEVTRALGRRLAEGLERLQRLPEHTPRPGEWAPWWPAHLGGDAVPRAASYELDVMPRTAVLPTWGPDPSGGPATAAAAITVGP